MRALLLVVLVLFGVGCEKLCVPGKSEACVGPGGCAGGQTCNAEGTGLGACDCGTAGGGSGGGGGGGGETGGGGGSTGGGGGSTGGGGGSTGGGGGSTGGGGGAIGGGGGAIGGGGGATGGGGQDAGVDAGVPACDPTPTDGGSTGCPSGQRCTWVELSLTDGHIACLPNGTVAVGGTCSRGTPGPTTGFDDCIAGSVCINGECMRTCSVNTPGSCGVDSCTSYSGLFANEPDAPLTGACTPTCNPLSQQPCASGQGCYLASDSTTTIALCANAGTVGHGQAITGTAFINSCVPGARPRQTAGLMGVECGGLCAPSEVTMGNNTVNEGGVAQESCQTRWGAAAPGTAGTGESCRYFWGVETFPELSPFSNTVGWCFKHAAFQYDSNEDTVPDAPFPRCTSLTTGDLLPPLRVPAENDALSFWCLEKPAMKRAQPKQSLAAPAVVPRITGWR